MTKDEIIIVMLEKGIITEIAGDYHLTEKYKELLSEGSQRVIMPVIKKEKRALDYEKLLNPQTNGQDWPLDILEAKGRDRAVALVVACEVPAMAHGYRLKGLDKDAVNIIGNIIDDPNIDPRTFIEAVKLYYKYIERPKAFKNLVKEGEILNLYNEHIEGTLKANLVQSGNDDYQWQ